MPDEFFKFRPLSYSTQKDELIYAMAYEDICENPILKLENIYHKIKVNKGIGYIV